MSHELSLAERRVEIDRRLELALDSADGGCVVPLRSATLEREDRWYGQLLALSHGSAAEPPDTSSVLSAATAIELLRGYVRLREQLLLLLDDEVADPAHRKLTTDVLASDYLYTSAYSTLGSLDDEHLEECFETLATVSESIIEALGRTYLGSTASSTEYQSVVDDTAGALGEGAAVIGATLAGVEDHHRDRYATVGRGFGTVHRIRTALAPDGTIADARSPPFDGPQLRRYAKRRLEATERALQALSPTADVDRLRAFVEDASSEISPDETSD